MKKFAMTILAAGATALAASTAYAGPAPVAPADGASLLHKTGGVYLEFGGPRYYGYDGYYDRYPAYRSYGYYGPRRYYGYGYGYGHRKYSRRWTKERFEHPLGRR